MTVVGETGRAFLGMSIGVVLFERPLHLISENFIFGMLAFAVCVVVFPVCWLFERVMSISKLSARNGKSNLAASTKGACFVRL